MAALKAGDSLMGISITAKGLMLVQGQYIKSDATSFTLSDCEFYAVTPNLGITEQTSKRAYLDKHTYQLRRLNKSQFNDVKKRLRNLSAELLDLKEKQKLTLVNKMVKEGREIIKLWV